MNAKEGSLDAKQEPRPLDVSGWTSDGEYLLIPGNLAHRLRPGSVLQTTQGELVVTGGGLRCVHRVAEDVRDGVIPYPYTSNPHPILAAAGSEFARRLREARGVQQPAFTRTGNRHK